MKSIISFSIFYILIFCYGFAQTVKFEYFNCISIDDSLQLSWKTFQEDGIDTFYLYSSSNGKNWTEINRQQNSNKQTGNIYFFTTKFDTETSYFKIRHKYSFLLTSFRKSPKITFFKNSVFIKANYHDQYFLYNTNGIQIQKIEDGTNYINQPIGIYFLINHFDHSLTKFFVHE